LSRTPIERAIHRRTTQHRPHANEFGGRETAGAAWRAHGGAFAAGRNPRAGCKSSAQADLRAMPRPGIFDRPAPPVMSARSLQRGDIGQQACSTGMASRTADGNHSGVARPYRHWATGDCTRCKKPLRLSLRQSSGAPRLPAITASKHRFIVPSRSRSCLPSCALLGRCNEERLLSRRIIIRLFDDVKKKVQKNLRARANRSNPRTHCDDNPIDSHADLNFHHRFEVPTRGRCAVIRCVAERVDDMRSHTRTSASHTRPMTRFPTCDSSCGAEPR